jgi:hypothetical protein
MFTEVKTFNLNSDEWDGTRDRDGWRISATLVDPRMLRTRAALAVAAVILALTAAGCGGASGPLQGVTTGMTAKAVRAKAGPPFRIDRANPRNPDCWVYGKTLAVCFKRGRADYVGH